MELIDKVKKAITDSGFPLEMQMARVLRDNGWTVSQGSRYEDFETSVLRELDIVADKSIGGIQVHLFIECKKSDNKQLVLYAPTHNRHPIFWFNPLRFFPRIPSGRTKMEARLSKVWSELPFFDPEILVSSGIIFTKGDKVEQNNDSFFVSLNGIIKKAISTASDGYIETDFRMMYLHLVIYDGIVYQLSDDETEPFHLKPIEYGQYKFDYRFKFQAAITNSAPDIIDTAGKFMLFNIIEIMRPNYFDIYLKALDKVLSVIPKKMYKGWGISLEDFTAQMVNEKPVS